MNNNQLQVNQDANQNANNPIPNGNGAAAGPTNNAANNAPPPPPPPPPSAPEASMCTCLSNYVSFNSHNDHLVDLVVGWNGPGGYACFLSLPPLLLGEYITPSPLI
ncbi:hypothetical protein FRC14_000310 [Serendipita sp. 396]|nr:hypothetical protein FRC14_000310 [Serendipita sp. 396]